jgi:hypothetical protein
MYIQRSLGAMGRNVVRVWDGAGRCNGRRTHGERCFLIGMGRAVDEKTADDRHTSRDHETGPADRLWQCWQKAGKR